MLGKVSCGRGSDGLDVVKESAEAKVETVDIARIQHARVVREKRMRIVDACLAKRSRTDGAIQRAGSYVVFALQRIAKEKVIEGVRLPVDALGAQQIVERRSGKSPTYCPSRQIAHANQRGAILIAVFK